MRLDPRPVDRSRCPSGDVQHPAAVALPRRQPPNHQRGDAINKHGEPDEHDQLKRAEYDHFHDLHDDNIDAFDNAIGEWRAYLGSNHDTVVGLVRAVFDAAAAVLGIDVAVDSAGDGVSGPADNTLRRLRDTDDGDLWRLLRRVLDPADPGYAYVDARDELLHAIAARYGNR